MTRLRDLIQIIPLIDTHEHLNYESVYLESGIDIFQTLFDNYVSADLISAGASQAAVAALIDPKNPDLEARWDGVKAAWEHCQHTGYGRAVRWAAKNIYGMEEISPQWAEVAAPRARARCQPGERLRILKEEGNLDHVQVDQFTWELEPDPAGPEFFLYDLSWVGFSRGEFDQQQLFDLTGVEVVDLKSLKAAMEALFARRGPLAVAVKSQHAYQRTLFWQEREDSAAEAVLTRYLRGEALSAEDSLCLGDWSLARGVELAGEYNLPFKIHTGYYAGNNHMVTDRIRAGHLSNLLIRYPGTRFVLMHIAYPYQEELVALAKHFPHVYVDMCWAWSINPYSSADFLRRMIHAVPVNKLFAFGGDTFWPDMSVAYANQARSWLNRALQAEVDDGFLTEDEAIAVATRLMQANQRDCFDLKTTRAAITAAL